jgi:ABC transporter substrate binding protein (PQQ-dependent alcohol dehydrogenase system)
MIDPKPFAALALAIALAASPAASAELAIGYLELEEDARYDDKWAYGGLLLQAGGRPFQGASLALTEAAFAGKVAGLEFALHRVKGANARDFIAAIKKLGQEKKVRFFLIDAPAAAVEDVAKATANNAILVNVSALDDTLRGRNCQPHLFHTVPSHAMLADALAQFLAAKKWRDVLILQGPLPEDKALTQAFERSAQRFGLKIVAKRDFVIGNDPRDRERNNLALLTGNADYDAVFVADSGAEFGRYVPYQTLLPRPVVGSSGLVPLAWHWAWERHGGPQLTRRFQRHAGRQMQGNDWAAWVAVKALTEAAIKTKTTDKTVLTAALGSGKLTIDGFKGPALSFRPWDRQLRQPILLASYDWVAERAPLSGFLHPLTTLDTLGFDEPESPCRAGKGEAHAP